MNCQDDGRVRFRDLQYVDVDEATFSAFRLEEGDLLFNRTNSIEHVGRTAIFEGAKEAVFASYLVRLKVDALRCLPRFLNYYMNRKEVQHDIKRPLRPSLLPNLDLAIRAQNHNTSRRPLARSRFLHPNRTSQSRIRITLVHKSLVSFLSTHS